ncbi:MAG: hypothetical protein ACREFF_06940 [Candidatus Udaeobacter sp.]
MATVTSLPADNDRFACARFSSYGDKARARLPLDLFHERKIFYP